MRTARLILFSILITTVAFAQTDKSNRNSISLINLEYDDEYSADIKGLFARFKLDARYDINDIPTKQILATGKRLQPARNGRYYAPDRTEQILLFLHHENIGRDIISFLFKRNNRTGEMSTQRIHERGLYNVSDQHIIESSATKRGIEDLKDTGFSLIDNSYLLIYDFANIRYEYQEGDDDDSDYYWHATPAAYLFKIVWSEALQNKLFDCWIDENTPAAERSKRLQAFSSLTVPVKFVSKSVDDNRSEATGIEEQRRKIKKGEKREYSDKELKNNSFLKMIYEATDYIGERIEGKQETLQIQNSLYNIDPLRSKIGRKEGIKVNDRYYVYEHVGSNNNSTKLVRKGVVKATSHIAENRQVATGHSPTTEFYQIAGGKLEEGMTLKEKQSYYLNLDLGYRYGKLEGVYAGLSSNLYATRTTNHNLMLGVTVWEKAVTTTVDYGFGLRCNNFDIYPYLGFGLDSFLKEKDEPDDTTGENLAWLAQGGIRFNLNLYYPMQLFGAVEYNYLLDESENYLLKKMSRDRDIEGINVYGGIRFCF